MSKRIGDARQPRIMGGGAPIVELIPQFGEDGCMRGIAREIDYFVRIRPELVQLFGRTMQEGFLGGEKRSRPASSR